MKNLHIARLVTVFSVLLHCAVSAQSPLLRKAERLYAQYSFAEAITCYEKAFAAGATDLEAARHLADSYRRVRDLKSSEKWYALIVSGPDATTADDYAYAEALRANAKYRQADSVMRAVSRRDKSDARAERFANTAELQGWLLVDPVFDATVEPAPFNSPQMDMAPSLYNDRLVFASSREQNVSVHRNHAWDDLPFLNLYTLQDDGTMKLLRGDVNTKYHESNATYNAEGTEMYFTRNNYLNGRAEEGEDGFNNLMIYRAEMVNGEWSNETAFVHNDPSFSTGHPCLSADGRTLYFSSNRPGGSGGVDIWKCERTDGSEWGAPENLGSIINTESDEMFPSINGDHALFFASDGHPGLGGLDLFLSWQFKNGPQPPINLGAPVNSRSDDMSLVLMDDNRTGYISSDRSGGLGGADVYEVQLETSFEQKVRISGRVVSAETGAPLERLPIRLVRPDHQIMAQQLSNANGRFEFIVKPQPLTVVGGVPGGADFELPMEEALLMASEGDLEMEDVRLTTLVNVPLEVRVLNAKTGLPAEGISVSVYDKNRPDTPLFSGTTDASGSIAHRLAGVYVGDLLALRVVMSLEGMPTAQSDVELRVVDGKKRVIEQPYDMGDRPLARNGLFPSDAGPEDGNVWSGRVIDALDKAPLANVPVSLLDERRVEIARTTTDADGRYTLRSHSVPASVEAAIPGGDRAELANIAPFGDQNLPDMELKGRMDLPVNALLRDAITDDFLEGVVVTVSDLRDGTLLFTGTTDATGLSQGSIPDRRFGTEENIEVSFSKTGYVPMTIAVDFSVLTFLEQALGGRDGFALIPSLDGLDLARAMNLRPIFFDYNDARIRTDAAGELDLVARVLQVDKALRVQLRSHTDSRGGDAFNRFLSVRRAQSTREYLIAQGIDPARLEAVGVGESELANRCANGVECSEVAHQENRRTEFLLKGSTGSRLAHLAKE